MRSSVVDEWFWIRRPTRGAGIRLVCLPHAGGDAAIYTGFAAAAPDWVEAWSVRLPGRGARFSQPLPLRAQDLVSALAAAVRRRVAAPFAIVGQSFGGMLGLHLCHALADDHPPAGLVVVACRSPDRWLYQRGPRTDDELIRALRALGPETPAQPDHPDIGARSLAVMRADLALSEQLRSPPAPLAVPVHAVLGERDPSLTPGEVTGWVRYTDREFHFSTVDAGHFPVHSCVPAVFAAISADLRSWAAA